jgi:TonB family protein
VPHDRHHRDANARDWQRGGVAVNSQRPSISRRRGLRARHSSIGIAGTAALIVAGLTACVTKDDAKKMVEALQESQPSRPDVLPVMLNREIPLRYPPALYSRKAQGNVTLRIFIDSAGRVHPESTVVAESSGEPAFDSAAVAGVKGLHFLPAQRRGVPVGVSILFPVFFRHPQGAPVPGDSVLRRGDSTRPGPAGQHADSARR